MIFMQMVGRNLSSPEINDWYSKGMLGCMVGSVPSKLHLCIKSNMADYFTCQVGVQLNMPVSGKVH